MRCAPAAADCHGCADPIVCTCQLLARWLSSDPPHALQSRQVRDQWLIASPVMGHQYDGYSDIVKKPTSYRDPKTGTPVVDERTQAQPAEY